MIDQYSQGVKAISDIEASVSKINKETQAIPETMLQLKSILEVNQHQINELVRHLGAFSKLEEKAAQALPKIQKHVETTVENIALSAQKASEGYQILLSNTNDVQKTFSDNINSVLKQVDSTVTRLVEKQIHEMDKSFDSLQDKVSESVDLTGEAVNKHLEMIDKSLNREVENVMTEMGGALATISGTFTTDYEKLTKAMKNITAQVEL